MKTISTVAATALLGLLATLHSTPPPAEGGTGASGELVTLYARDDLRSSYSFRWGKFGGRVVDGEIVLSGAQIVFDVLQENQVSFGVAQEEFVDVVDLGDAYVSPFRRQQDSAVKFPVSVYRTLFYDGARFAYVGPGNKKVPYRPASAILGVSPARGLRHFEPVVGHTYLLRYKSEGRSRYDEVVKFEVVDYEPGRTLTFRWDRLASL